MRYKQFYDVLFLANCTAVFSNTIILVRLKTNNTEGYNKMLIVANTVCMHL